MGSGRGGCGRVGIPCGFVYLVWIKGIGYLCTCVPLSLYICSYVYIYNIILYIQYIYIYIYIYIYMPLIADKKPNFGLGVSDWLFIVVFPRLSRCFLIYDC